MGKRNFYKDEKMKRYIYVFGVTLVISIVVFLTIFVMYNKKIKKEASMKFENLGVIEDIVSNENLEQTSSTSDKGIKDKNKNETSKENTVNKKINKTPVSSTITNTEKNKSTKSENEVVNNVKSKNDNSVRNELSNTVNNVVENVAVEEKKIEELNFKVPVSGEIIKDFAIDNLIFSKTLEEWTTHSGIDIKAEKTSVVVAAEKGTVESIKNDPRFGLTITIAHEDGFKTVYSNLLTTEFVTENEVVEKGQTIATVGETASFEVADEPHLHFEMYKNGSPVNPTIYLK